MNAVARLQPTGVRKIDIANKIPLLRGGASMVRLQGCVIHAQSTHPSQENAHPLLLFNLPNTHGLQVTFITFRPPSALQRDAVI
jgi:hypothetical protein